jgi:ketosteroid isomerase-like protein
MMTPDEFMRAYEAATNDHDLERTLDLIADDAIYWFSDASAHCGKTMIARALQRNFESIRTERYCIEDLVWLASSDSVAACAYGFRWTGEVDGKSVAGQGRGTSVIKRVDGNWRVVHEHLSRGTPR